MNFQFHSLGAATENTKLPLSFCLSLGTARRDSSAVFSAAYMWLRGRAVLFHSVIGGSNPSSFGFSLGANEQMPRVEK